MREKHSFRLFEENEAPKCEAVQGALSMRMDGELSESDAALVEQHLRQCSRCSEESRELAAAERLLGSAASKKLSATLWSSLEHRLLREGMIRPVPEPASSRAPLAVAASVLVASGLAGHLIQGAGMGVGLGLLGALLGFCTAAVLLYSRASLLAPGFSPVPLWPVACFVGLAALVAYAALARGWVEHAACWSGALVCFAAFAGGRAIGRAKSSDGP